MTTQVKAVDDILTTLHDDTDDLLDDTDDPFDKTYVNALMIANDDSDDSDEQSEDKEEWRP